MSSPAQLSRPPTPQEPKHVVADQMPLFRLSIDQYHQMVRSGILGEDDRVELLDGLLVRKMSKNPPHSTATGIVQDVFQAIVPGGWHVRVQDTLTLWDSEPEPDLVVARGQRRDYQNRHPGPADLALLIEVADSSLDRDRVTKKQVYAAAGVPLYWIINLVDQQVEVFTEPTGAADLPDYRTLQIYTRGQSVPLMIGEQQIGPILVNDLLP
jgi:Uma2 family endonuclease